MLSCLDSDNWNGELGNTKVTKVIIVVMAKTLWYCHGVGKKLVPLVQGGYGRSHINYHHNSNTTVDVMLPMFTVI